MTVSASTRSGGVAVVAVKCSDSSVKGSASGSSRQVHSARAMRNSKTQSRLVDANDSSNAKAGASDANDATGKGKRSVSKLRDVSGTCL